MDTWRDFALKTKFRGHISADLDATSSAIYILAGLFACYLVVIGFSAAGFADSIFANIGFNR